jgi:hypothetical protein
MSYRAYLQKWVGKPLTKPSVAVRRSDGKTDAYVSWNGATQVTRWRVKSASGATLASAQRDGFETKIPLAGGGGKIEVQALGVSGNVLGTSAMIGAS